MHHYPFIITTHLSFVQDSEEVRLVPRLQDDSAPLDRLILTHGDVVHGGDLRKLLVGLEVHAMGLKQLQ